MNDFLTRRSLVIGTAAFALAAKPGRADQYPDDPYQVQRLPANTLPQEFRRTVVPYGGRHFPGTIIVDTASRHLYHVLPGGEAIRFGCGVGREGFAWAGQADVGRKVMWPRWTPPKEMVERDDNARKWKNGMPGGPDNPLGARALYLFQNGNDTLYRIHGTNAPRSIGTAASSGCIRMLNEDVTELYRRAPIGSRVVVLAEGV